MPYTPIDGTEEITELPVVEYAFGGSENWTLEEQMIGTYLGKPLYRMGFKSTTPANGAQTILHTLDTKIIDTVIKIKAYIHAATADFEVGYENSTGNTSGIFYATTTGGINMWCKNVTGWTNQPMTVFVEYTKKTD